MKRDSDLARGEIEAALLNVQGVHLFRVRTYRQKTLKSIAGGALDFVADEIIGGEPVSGERSGRPGEPGWMVEAFGEGGQFLGHHALFPVEPDLPEAMMPAVIRAAVRNRAHLEVHVATDLRERREGNSWERSQGYRDPGRSDVSAHLPALQESGFAIDDTQRSIAFEQSQAPVLWMGLFYFPLLLLGWPITLLAMLFRESREVLLGIGRSIVVGHRYQWSARIQGNVLRIDERESGQTPQQGEAQLHGAYVLGWDSGFAPHERHPKLVIAGAHEGVSLNAPRKHAREIAHLIERWASQL